MKQSVKYLGIMVYEADHIPPFRDQRFYHQLCITAYKCGVSCYVFSPVRIDWLNQTVVGYQLDRVNDQWVKRIFPLPRIVYDRCFYRSSSDISLYRSHIKRLRRQQGILFLGNGLLGKWYVHQILSKRSELQPYLPETLIYQGKRMLANYLKNKHDIFLKPQSGSQGKRTFRIRSCSAGYQVDGRDGRNRTFQHTFDQLKSLIQWADAFIGSRKYLVQPYLHLTDLNNKCFDVRALVQKNGSGKWQLTGLAVRQGKSGSLTSNLHGGGTAVKAWPFLESIYGEKRAAEIIKNILQCSELIPDLLEQEHGRLAELGIDFGIDHSGKLWILEANSKPGRSIFSKLKDWKARRTSLQNPIRYASFIMDRQLGG